MVAIFVGTRVLQTKTNVNTCVLCAFRRKYKVSLRGLIINLLLWSLASYTLLSSGVVLSKVNFISSLHSNRPYCSSVGH